VASAGNFALLAGLFGLQVIDVSNPANCAQVGGYYLNPAHLEVRKVHFHSIKWAF
jgi:hypothetical protein